MIGSSHGYTVRYTLCISFVLAPDSLVMYVFYIPLVWYCNCVWSSYFPYFSSSMVCFTDEFGIDYSAASSIAFAILASCVSISVHSMFVVAVVMCSR